jgi:NAD(P)-dependent dehydrogenase (short-subunit alcohol dehydrogenase family)
MDLELSRKVAVVTGASKGIGLAVVRALAAEGTHVIAGARTVDALDGLDGVAAFEVDLAAPGGPEQLVARAIERHDRIDILVNNVGRVQLRLDGFLTTSDDDFESSLQINFFAALRATRAAVAAMLPRRAGAIVNVASVNAFFHPDGLVIDYGAGKAALLNVAKALSQELGPHGIRINSVSPGRSRQTSGSATMSSLPPSARRRAPAPQPCASRPSPESRRAASAPPRRSRRSSSCSPRPAPPTSRARTT